MKAAQILTIEQDETLEHAVAQLQKHLFASKQHIYNLAEVSFDHITFWQARNHRTPVITLESESKHLIGHHSGSAREATAVILNGWRQRWPSTEEIDFSALLKQHSKVYHVVTFQRQPKGDGQSKFRVAGSEPRFPEIAADSPYWRQAS